MDIATGHDRSITAAVTVDEAGSFLSVSPAFLELIGRPVESLAGATLVDYVPPPDKPTVRQFLSVAAGGSSPIGLLTRVFDADESWLPCELSHEGGTAERIVLKLHVERAGSDPVGSPATPDAGAAAHGTAAPRRSPELEEPDEPEDDYPYDDTPEHLAYVATFPDDDIVDRRAAVRSSAGPTGTPMLEIDERGRTVYVAGRWADLDPVASGLDDTEADRPVNGAAVFERLLERSSSAEAVLQSIDDACARSIEGRHPLSVPGLPPRWVQVLPIPSPHHAAVTHALVSILAESELGR